MNAVRCDGSCEQHEGEVARVHVRGQSLADSRTVNYCAAALAEARGRGFTIMLSSIQPAAWADYGRASAAPTQAAAKEETDA